LAQFLETAASIQTELGQFVEAGEKLEESQAIREKAGQAVGSEEFDGNISARIRLALAREQYDRATGLLEKLSAAAPTADQLDLQEIYNNLLSAEVAFAAGRYAGAIGLAQKVRRKIQTSPAAAYYQTLVSRADFIEGYANLLDGDSRSAMPLLQQALLERQEHLSASSPEIAEAQIALAEGDLSSGNLAAARELAAAAVAIDSAHKQLGPQYREPLKKLQAKLARTPIAKAN
jgi:tetratricopeptide (TPR) repeat protein